MPKPRKKKAGKDEPALAVKELPWQMRLFADIVMLRSTWPTAVFWGGFLLIMSVHLVYACGWMPAWTGLDKGFARVVDITKDNEARAAVQAADDQKRESRIAGVEKKIDWELKLTLTREVRDASAALCKSRNASERDSLQTYIDQLLEEYTRVTGKTLTQPPCPHP